MSLLELRGIGMEFGAIRALAEIDYAVAAGEIVCLIGDNGAGKSTLVKIIAGNFSADARDHAFRGASGAVPRTGACTQRRHQGGLSGSGTRRHGRRPLWSDGGAGCSARGGGEGSAWQVIDLPLLDPLFSFIATEAAIYRLTGEVRERTGSRSETTSPRNVFRTKDGRYIGTSASIQAMAERLFRAIGREILVDLPDTQMGLAQMHNVIPRLSVTPGGLRSPAPALGEHTAERASLGSTARRSKGSRTRASSASSVTCRDGFNIAGVALAAIRAGYRQALCRRGGQARRRCDHPRSRRQRCRLRERAGANSGAGGGRDRLAVRGRCRGPHQSAPAPGGA